MTENCLATEVVEGLRMYTLLSTMLLHMLLRVSVYAV